MPVMTTSTSAPSATATSGAPPATPVPPVKLPRTGLGGKGDAFAHNAAMGRVYRADHGTVALGSNTEPGTGSGTPISPIVPILLGLLVLGLGVLTRQVAVAGRH
jgi:hypothetical protein